MKLDIINITFYGLIFLIIFVTGFYVINIMETNTNACLNYHSFGYITKMDMGNCYVMTKQGNWIFYEDIVITKDDLNKSKEEK